jgi:hypothetical protein
MVQVQIRITYKEDGTLQLLYEVLPREDANESELSIAQSLESSFRSINRQAAQVAGLPLQEVKIRGKKNEEAGLHE